MALNDQLQVAAVQKEKYGTKDGALGYTTHHGADDEEEDPTRTCCSRFETGLYLCCTDPTI